MVCLELNIVLLFVYKQTNKKGNFMCISFCMELIIKKIISYKIDNTYKIFVKASSWVISFKLYTPI